MKYLLIFLILAGCSMEYRAARHLRMAEKHVRHAQILGANVKADTVFKNIPVFVAGVAADTVFKTELGDTVVITKDRLKVKYVHLPGDTVYLKGECLPDTVFVNVPVQVTQEITAPPDRFRWWHWAIAGAVAMLVIILVLRFR